MGSSYWRPAAKHQDIFLDVGEEEFFADKMRGSLAR